MFNWEEDVITFYYCRETAEVTSTREKDVIIIYYCRKTTEPMFNWEKDVITFGYCRETAEITSIRRKDVITVCYCRETADFISIEGGTSTTPPVARRWPSSIPASLCSSRTQRIGGSLGRWRKRGSNHATTQHCTVMQYCALLYAASKTTCSYAVVYLITLTG